MTTNNHPAHGPVSLKRLHQIREILSKAAAQSDGVNLGYAMADAVKVIDGAIAAFGADPQRNPVLAYADSYRDMAKRGVESIPVWSVITDLERNIAPLYTAPTAPVVSDREKVRREHAEWSDATFGDVGPVGPLKHLSKEALEAAAEPGDLSEWADMQFLLWDAQRRAGISDKQITLAMVDKLAINKQRQWPEPKDGEPRVHIKEAGNSPVNPEGNTCKYCGGTGYFRWQKSANTFPCPCMGCDLPAAPQQPVIGIDLASEKDASVEVVIENGKVRSHG
ncbi:hypothetical protein AZ002_003427 [Citrobacter freundii]|nr:DUF550 domain-containing protein [Citrobacter freundii]OUE61216.1 hypothetical protein AZ002_003427 [Citrobacter freundii]